MSMLSEQPIILHLFFFPTHLTSLIFFPLTGWVPERMSVLAFKKNEYNQVINFQNPCLLMQYVARKISAPCTQAQLRIDTTPNQWRAMIHSG